MSKTELIMTYLSKFYKTKNQSNLNIIIPIIQQKDKQISLRILDWFSTNYCRQYKIFIKIKENHYIDVYQSYKNELKSYSKEFFDAFCRNYKIKYFYDHQKYLCTTPAQLNFFRWAIQNKIIQYIKDHFNVIEREMTNHFKEIKLKINNDNEKKLKKEINISKVINKRYSKIIVKF
jgi:hypothetical protein